MTTRRAFLRRLAAAVLGVALVRELPGIAPVPDQVTEEPLDIDAARHVSRLDVRYGAMMFQPEWAVRVTG